MYPMKKIALLALALCSPITAGAQETLELDTWTGTVEVGKNGLLLKRCATGQTIYELVDHGRAEDSALARLNALLKDAKSPATVTVIAHYRKQAEEHQLIVEGFDEFQEGKSCHLLDLLEALFALPEPDSDT